MATPINPTEPAPTESQPKWQLIALFAFGVIFLSVLLWLVLGNHKELDSNQCGLVRVVLALCAAGIGAIVPGTISANAPKLAQAGGAAAFFVIVLMVYKCPDTGKSPLTSTNPAVGSSTNPTGSSNTPPTTGPATAPTDTTSSTTGSATITPPPIIIPPLVKGGEGAPVGATFQWVFVKDEAQCIKETTKVSATGWEERVASNSPASCNSGEVVMKFSQRESDDPQYFLLYDSGRDLLIHMPIIGVGQTGHGESADRATKNWSRGGPLLTRVK